MFGLLKFGVKAGIISSAIYITIEQGVWRDSETTSELYKDLKNKMIPLMRPVTEQIPFTIPQLPKTGDLMSSAKTAWNKGVMASCLFLVELPELSWKYAKQGGVYAFNKINEGLQNLNQLKDNDENNIKRI